MLDLKVIDTYYELKTYDPKILWFGHHASFGNEVVCDLIKEGILK